MRLFIAAKFNSLLVEEAASAELPERFEPVFEAASCATVRLTSDPRCFAK